MQPRVHHITSTSGKRQSTPAPLLLTRRGQLPNLPVPLAERALPDGDTFLLSVPALDWHIINSNTGRGAVNLPIPPAGIPQLTGHLKSIFVLCVRAAGSRQTLCDTPGKSVSVRLDPSNTKAGMQPSEYARLHKILKTDFVIAPTDAPFYTHVASNSSKKRRAQRSIEQCKSFVHVCLKKENMDPRSLIASVQGGVDRIKEHGQQKPFKTGTDENGNSSNGTVGATTDTHSHNNREQCAMAVCALGATGGISIDGLYSGERPDDRANAISSTFKGAAAAAMSGLRILTGGTGAPWEVLRAVSLGIDIIDASFPFEMAEKGYGTQLVRLQSDSSKSTDDDMSSPPCEYINVRDRKWEINTNPVVDGCPCFVCEGYSRAYLRHLFEVHEMMGVTFLTAHNIWDYLSWFKLLRKAVAANRLDTFIGTYERRRRIRERDLAQLERRDNTLSAEKVTKA